MRDQTDLGSFAVNGRFFYAAAAAKSTLGGSRHLLQRAPSSAFRAEAVVENHDEATGSNRPFAAVHLKELDAACC